MKRIGSYYEVVSIDDGHKLCGTFDTSTTALDHLNDSYYRALKLGYDNRHERWLIVKVDHVKLWDSDGSFQMEETTRYMVERPKFSEKYECYILTY